MTLIEELIENIVNYADYRYNCRREKLRDELELKGFRVYFAHELGACKNKSQLKRLYPKLEAELMYRPPLILGEIVQRGVKAYLPKDVEEERVFKRFLGNIAILGTPDFYSESRKSVYELKFMRGEPKVLEHHRLRANIYRWLSNAEHSYLLYCSPKGFKEFEVDDDFNEKHVKALIEKWNSPMWEWECKLCVYRPVCSKQDI